MDKIPQEIPERLQQPISDVINNAIVETFLTVFNVPVVGAERILRHQASQDDYACQVRLIESDMEIDVVFVFAKPLVKTILNGVYSEEDLATHTDAYHDAACEIANIVCAHLKAFLNQKGFELKMHLPLPMGEVAFERISRNAINLYFTLNQNNKDLLVNVRMFTGKESGDSSCVA